MTSETILIGDRVRLADGTIEAITHANIYLGLYWVGNQMLYRHQFTPLKWENDVIGVTGIGVCAAGGAGQ